MNLTQLRKELEKHYDHVTFYQVALEGTPHEQSVWELDGNRVLIFHNKPKPLLYQTMWRFLSRQTPNAERKFTAWANALERGHSINMKQYKKMTAKQMDAL